MTRNTEQGKRLSKLIDSADLAFENEFYLECAAICFAIIEERLRSILKKIKGRELGKKHKIDSCLTLIEKENKKNTLLKSYITKDLLDKIFDWKNQRNVLTHQLIQNGFEPDLFKDYAKLGRQLMADLAKSIMKWKRQWKKINC